MNTDGPPPIPKISSIREEEFLAMQALAVEELRRIAFGHMTEAQMARHFDLLDKNSNSRISFQERQELDRLRHVADLFVLKKTYAWSVLVWRGYPAPSLAELERMASSEEVDPIDQNGEELVPPSAAWLGT